MIRKLAVTAFVLSFAALGCGSDNGTPAKKDTGVADGPATNKDVAPTPDQALVSPDVNQDVSTTTPDTSGQPDAQVATDVGSVSEAGGPVVDAGGTTDTHQAVDTAGTDTAQVHIDGGADSQVGEAGGAADAHPAIDGGAIDSGSAG